MLGDIALSDIYRLSADSQEGVENGPKKRLIIPLFTESVAAGFPSPASDYIEAELDLNELCIDNPIATFFVRVRGLSMIGAGIKPDDLLVVDRSVKARDGAIVVALLEHEYTLKRLRITAPDHYWLVPENPDFQSIEIKGEMHFEVWGVVLTQIHFFGNNKFRPVQARPYGESHTLPKVENQPKNNLGQTSDAFRS